MRVGGSDSFIDSECPPTPKQAMDEAPATKAYDLRRVDDTIHSGMPHRNRHTSISSIMSIRKARNMGIV